MHQPVLFGKQRGNVVLLELLQLAYFSTPVHYHWWYYFSPRDQEGWGPRLLTPGGPNFESQVPTSRIIRTYKPRKRQLAEDTCSFYIHKNYTGMQQEG